MATDKTTMRFQRFFSPVLLTVLLSAFAHASVIVTTLIYSNQEVSGASRDGGIWVESWTDEGHAVTHSHRRQRRKRAVLEESDEATSEVKDSGEEESDSAFAPQAAASGTIYGEEEVDTPVKMIRPPALRYPASAYRDGLEGEVELFLVVDEHGQVVEVETIKETNHIFNGAAQDAARTLRFSPALKNKLPVRVHVHWTCRFRLE